MIKVFNSPFKVSQEFGARPEYYKKISKGALVAHEGVDLVPTGTDWTVFTLPYKGIVVKDIDMGLKLGFYGILNTIWYPDIQEAWMYCHLASNRVYLGQELSPATPLGIMGATGNTTGPHLHQNRFKVDQRGYRLNKDNGYLGGIDPVPFLMQDIGEIVTETAGDPFKKKALEILEEYRGQREQGPEGNYEGFVRAIIGNDREIVVVRSQVASATQALADQSVKFADEKKNLEETLKKGFDTDKVKIELDCQSRVKTASIGVLSERSAGELLEALINKILPKKGGGLNE